MTSQTPSGAGSLVDIDGRPALRFERRYQHSVERVWRAVCDPIQMAQWFPSRVDGDRAVGARLVFDDSAQRTAAREAGELAREEGPPVTGTVVAFDPPTVFSFTWGGELLRFELRPDDGGTILTFTQMLSHESVAARNGAGWHACLAGLDQLLGAPTPIGGEDGWNGLYEDYLDRMGPPLGVPSPDGSMTWERSTHVPPERVVTTVTRPDQLRAWGAPARPDQSVHWEIVPAEHGTVYRLTHACIDGDAELAATWHALLLQLDMYLAAGQLLPADRSVWIAAYRTLA